MRRKREKPSHFCKDSSLRKIERIKNEKNQQTTGHMSATPYVTYIIAYFKRFEKRFYVHDIWFIYDDFVRYAL